MGFLADIFTANQDRKAQTKAADRASTASTAATDKSLALQKSMFDTLWGGTAVQRAAGDAATRQMAQLMGLNLGAAGQTPAPGQPAQPQAQPGRPGQPGIGGGQPGQPVQQFSARNALMGEEPLSRGGGMQFPQQNQLSDGNALAMPANFGGPQVMPQIPGQPQVMPLQPGAPATGATPATGGNALNPTDWLRSTPGWDFNYTEGARALNTKLAGQGRLQSGDASREAIRYGQNFADRIYGDQWNRLAGIAGAGQTAQAQGQQAGQNYVNNGSNALMWNGSNQMQSSYNRGNAQSGFWGAVGGSINNAENMAMRFMGGF